METAAIFDVKVVRYAVCGVRIRNRKKMNRF